jgi:hypothetical protein
MNPFGEKIEMRGYAGEKTGFFAALKGLYGSGNDC